MELRRDLNAIPMRGNGRQVASNPITPTPAKLKSESSLERTSNGWKCGKISRNCVNLPQSCGGPRCRTAATVRPTPPRLQSDRSREVPNERFTHRIVLPPPEVRFIFCARRGFLVRPLSKLCQQPRSQGRGFLLRGAEFSPRGWLRSCRVIGNY